MQDSKQSARPASYRVATLLGLVVMLLAVTLAIRPDRGREPVTLAVGRSVPSTPSTPSSKTPSTKTPSTKIPSTKILSRDERFRRAAIGTWRDFYRGKRTMTLREDGTATMVVELSGLKARLFTPRLELDIVWSIEDGRMKRRTVGGTPADKIEFVNRRAGRQVAEPILELTEDRLRLLDKNGTTRYDWRRVR